MRRLLAVVLVSAGLTAAACGVSAEQLTTGGGADGSDPLPVTTVVTQHLPTAPDHAGPGEEGEDDIAAALVRYGPADSWSTENLRLGVYAAAPSDVDEDVSCDDDSVDGCEKSTLADGSTLYLMWQLEEPQEDPGIISMIVVRDDAIVGMRVTGPTITEHPAELDLGYGVDLAILKEILADPRLTPESAVTP